MNEREKSCLQMAVSIVKVVKDEAKSLVDYSVKGKSAEDVSAYYNKMAVSLADALYKKGAYKMPKHEFVEKLELLPFDVKDLTSKYQLIEHFTPEKRGHWADQMQNALYAGIEEADMAHAEKALEYKPEPKITKEQGRSMLKNLMSKISNSEIKVHKKFGVSE